MTVDTNTIFVDAPNHRLGVGISTPASTLTVKGQIEIVTGGNGLKFPDGTVQTTAAVGGATSWSLTGNSGTTAGTSFIGTTDAQDFVVKTSSIEALRVTSGGNLSFANGSQMIAPRVENSTSQPSAPHTGQLFYDTTAGLLAVFNGTEWRPVAPIVQSSKLGSAGATILPFDNIVSVSLTKYASGTSLKMHFNANYSGGGLGTQFVLVVDGTNADMTRQDTAGTVTVDFSRVVGGLTAGSHTISIQPTGTLTFPAQAVSGTTSASLIVEEF